MTRAWRGGVAALVGVVALGACGSGSSSNAIDSTASRWLQAEVAAARSSAARGNNADARSELLRVVNDAQTFRDRHMIGADRASEIQLDAQRAISAINVATTSTTTSTTTATVPSPTAPQGSAPSPGPPQPHKHGHGKGGD